MRILVISDIHANLSAFQAVLEDAKGQWDKLWCLGDLIGYGPDPNECIELIQEYDHVSLSGNHDWAVLAKLDASTFNPEAQHAIRWTRETITETNRDYLDSLPTTLVEEPFTLAHASPRQPVWEYILDQNTAAINFHYFDTAYCLVGHTHVPVTFSLEESDHAVAQLPEYGEGPIKLSETRQIINPGSVGQPRDSDPRAAYAFLDTEEMTWEYKRVHYPIHKTQSRMRQHALPPRLIKRLEFGW